MSLETFLFLIGCAYVVATAAMFRIWRHELRAFFGALALLSAACAETGEGTSVPLTDAEREFLAAHADSIRLGSDSHFAPIEFFDAGGRHRGMAADYVAIVERRLGVRFRVVRHATFASLMDDVRSRRVDMVASMQENAERRRYLDFTSPFSSVPVVYVAQRNRAMPFSAREGCDGCRVGVVAGYAVQKELESQSPTFEIVPVSDEIAGLRDVSFGRLDAMAINLATASYHIENEGISNLRVSGDVGPINEVGFGTRNDWPLLHSAVGKALASISREERREIRKRWIQIEQPFWREARFWYGTGAVVGAILLVFALIVAWNRALRRTVALRTRELERASEERSRLEAELAQSQKMEALGRLAGGIAHDFNNLLTVILGYGEFLRLSLEGEGAPHEEIDEILLAASRASELTKQLLAFSRKQVEGPAVVLDFGAAVAGSQKLIRRLIGEDVRLDLRLDESPMRVRIDPVQLDQIVLNLAINAKDAMTAGDSLVIATSGVEIDGATADVDPEMATGSYAVLEVTDTGHGMTKEVLERLFEPFFTTKEQGKGTGLGLSVVYGIVKHNGGHIRVWSAPDEGTTFRVYLPRVRDDGSEVRPVETARPAPAARATAAILLVEDERVVRELARRLLTEAGYDVVDAEDGARAIEKFDEAPFRFGLLVTDVIMPGMNGRQLFAALKERKPDLKVLYVSGYTADIVAHPELERDGGALLAKPFSRESLIGHVEKALGTVGGDP